MSVTRNHEQDEEWQGDDRPGRRGCTGVQVRNMKKTAANRRVESVCLNELICLEGPLYVVSAHWA